LKALLYIEKFCGLQRAAFAFPTLVSLFAEAGECADGPHAESSSKSHSAQHHLAQQAYLSIIP